MTKRMLSLLLALVMTLSLCVPALAADEFEAETVTEVEEQAPEAPAEPEAPEAEEVAEPVVEEPVEEPEIAAAIAVEAEDEAMVIADPQTMDEATLKNTLKTEDSVTLPSDVNLSSGLSITGTKTIDLNGHAITGSQTITIGKDAKLTVKDSTYDPEDEDYTGTTGAITVNGDDGAGELVVESGATGLVTITTANDKVTVSGGKVASFTVTKGTLTVKGGESGAVTVADSSASTVTVTGGELGNITMSDVDAVLKVSGGKVGTIMNGVVTVSGSAETGLITINDENASLTVTGGTVGGVVASKGTLTVENGTIKNASGAAVAITCETASDVKATIRGGTFTGSTQAVTSTGANKIGNFVHAGKFVPALNNETASAVSDADDLVDMGLTIATFAGTGETPAAYTIVGKAAVEAAAKALTKGTVSVVQGAADFKDLADTVKVTNTSGAVTVDDEELKTGNSTKTYEAEIVGGTKYESFVAAVGKAGPNDTVHMLADVVLSGSSLAISTSMTIDMDGHVLKTASGAGIEISGGTTAAAPVNVTFRNDGNIKKDTDDISITGAYTTLTLVDVWSDCDVKASTSGNLVVDKDSTVNAITVKGDVTVAGKATDAIKVDMAGATVTLTGVAGDTVEVKGDGAAFNMSGSASIANTLTLGDNNQNIDGTISGGTVTGSVALSATGTRSGLTISGGLFKATTNTLTAGDSWETAPITGGVFASTAAPQGIREGYGVAKITDSTDYGTGKETPIAGSGYHYVGASIQENVSKLTASDLDAALEVESGTVTLTALPDGIDVGTAAAAGTTFKYGNVTLANGATGITTTEVVPSKSIKELDSLITKALAVQGSGKLSDDDQLKLAKAVVTAMGNQTGKTNVTANIAALKALLPADADANKTELNAAITAAEALDKAKYTEASWTPFAAALAAAKDVAANASATEAQIKTALDNLTAAQNALVEATVTPTTPEIPAAPAGGTGWVKDSEGTWYYYEKNELQKGWIFTGSKHGLWYYTDADGKLVTGFKEVKDTKEPKYDGWYYFTPSGDCIGAVTSGWQNVGGTTGWGYFEKRHNGHFGACTYTDAQGDYVNYQPKA